MVVAVAMKAVEGNRRRHGGLIVGEVRRWGQVREISEVRDIMKTKLQALIAFLAVVVMTSVPVFAHHGDAAYASTPRLLKGCVVTA